VEKNECSNNKVRFVHNRLYHVLEILHKYS